MTYTQLNRWRGEFGEAYTRRNLDLNFSPHVNKSMKGFFCDVLENTINVCKVLEIGCNTGHNLVALSQLDRFELTGIDPQFFALKTGIKKNDTAQMINGSVYALPFSDRYFDLIMTVGVLMHVGRQDLADALSEIDRTTNKYFLTVDYFDAVEVAVEYRGYSDMLWRRDMRVACGEIVPHMKLIWEKRMAQDPTTGKYTWAFLFEKK